MRSYKLAKYNIKSSLKSIIIYYTIFIAVITIMTILGTSSGEDVYTSGLELSSIIFLFVIGLNSFKENFYFAQANNISRADYLKAAAIGILPIGLAMSILDVIINRVYNLFRTCPTIYDMAYNSSFGSSFNIEAWIQSNSVETLFRTVTFLFAVYIVVFALGLLITMIYYKCSKIMKVVVSISPVAIIAILANIEVNDPGFGEKVEILIKNILGLYTRNSYIAVLTFICLFIITIGFVYLLVRKATVKRI
jgi:hypothetical protein